MMSPLDYLAEHIAGGGQLVISCYGRPAEYVVGYEFGQEADDSPMAGGAAYATGPSLDLCMAQVAEECGWPEADSAAWLRKDS